MKVQLIVCWMALAFALPAAFGQKAKNPLVAQIESGDAAQQQAALAQMHAEIEKDGNNAAGSMRNVWAGPMLKTGLHDELAELCQAGIVRDPGYLTALETYLYNRALAHRQAGRFAEALADAKSLYNVSSMKTTVAAMTLLADILRDAHPDRPERVKRFKLEQIEGATTRPATTQPADGAAPSAEAATPSVLAGITIDAELYEEAIDARTAETYAAQFARGNLLLVADRPAEARKAFELASALAGDEHQQTQIAEALARTLKAEDGSIGRANAWVLSLRPAP